MKYRVHHNRGVWHCTPGGLYVDTKIDRNGYNGGPGIGRGGCSNNGKSTPDYRGTVFVVHNNTTHENLGYMGSIKLGCCDDKGKGRG